MANEYSNMSPDEIERDIEDERSSLASTIDEMQHRLSLDGMFDGVGESLSRHGSDIGQQVMRAVRENPIALALAGASIAALVMGSRDGSRDDDYSDRRYGRSGGRLGPAPRRYADPDEVGRVGDRRSFTERVGDADRDVRRGMSGGYSGDVSTPETTSSGGSSRWDRSDLITRRYAADEFGDPDYAGRSTAGGRFGGGSTGVATTSGVTSGRAPLRERDFDRGDFDSSDIDRDYDGDDDGEGRMQQLRRRARQQGRSMQSSAQDLLNRVNEGTSGMSQEGRNRVTRARLRAVEAQHEAERMARRGADEAEQFFHRNPLAAGAAALAFGAALGAALPRTRQEDEAVGEYRDRLFDEAQRVYEEESRKLQKVGERAADEARTAAREMKEEAKEKGRSEGSAAEEKARSAGQRIADAAQDEAEKQKLGSSAPTDVQAGKEKTAP